MKQEEWHRDKEIKFDGKKRVHLNGIADKELKKQACVKPADDGESGLEPEIGHDYHQGQYCKLKVTIPVLGHFPVTILAVESIEEGTGLLGRLMWRHVAGW